MDIYFSRIKALSGNEAALDSRHRFMLLDLMEQRRNRWRPRKEVRFGWAGLAACSEGWAACRPAWLRMPQHGADQTSPARARPAHPPPYHALRLCRRRAPRRLTRSTRRRRSSGLAPP